MVENCLNDLSYCRCYCCYYTDRLCEAAIRLTEHPESGGTDDVRVDDVEDDDEEDDDDDDADDVENDEEGASSRVYSSGVDAPTWRNKRSPSTFRRSNCRRF